MLGIRLFFSSIIFAMFNRIPRLARILLIVIGLLILAVAIYNIPYVNERLSWRLDDLRSQIMLAIKPPAVFQPSGQRPASPNGTLPPPQILITPQTAEANTTASGPTLTPTITPTPLPTAVTLSGVKYVDQNNRWNYCGPANLTMALNFWGWKGNRDDVAKAIKPGENDPNKDFIQKGRTDKNVMPYEMVDFVSDDTDYHALMRYGGNLDLLKSFIASGYPMLIEKGEYQKDSDGHVSWMGHYQFITAYDDNAKAFTVQDTYIDGPNFKVSYEKLSNEWRAFNYLFLVIYPADREPRVHDLLGNWADSKWANQHALEIAEQDIKTTTGLDNYFAWFNKGSSYVQLQQYVDAANAYDQAFLLYPNLPLDKDKLPYRTMYYQTGPYWAYYYSGRYQDVVALANTTLDRAPTMEESLYWRGLAELSIGNRTAAIKDLQDAVYYNKYFTVAIDQLKSIGAPLVP